MRDAGREAQGAERVTLEYDRGPAVAGPLSRKPWSSGAPRTASRANASATQKMIPNVTGIVLIDFVSIIPLSV